MNILTTHDSPLSAHVVWGLLDDKAGHANQVRGLVEALGLSHRFLSLTYSTLSRLPNLMLGATLAHLSPESRAAIAAPFPNLVIACGRRTEPVARFIKQHSPETRIVYIMTPANLEGWDAIIVPEHDAPKKRGHILTTHGPLHRITPERLAEARTQWAAHFAHLPAPHVGVLVGDVSVHDATAMLSRAQELAGGDGSLLITTSRRTLKGLLAPLLPHLKRPYFLHDVHSTPANAANPYLGILACSSRLIVSGDSLSMCAEAVASGAPTHIAELSGLPTKHRAMHAMLFAHGHALRLIDTGNATHQHPATPTNDTLYAADALKARFGL